MEEGDYLIKEREHQEIYRKLLVPEEASPDRAEATRDHGVLRIMVTKKTTRTETKHKVEIK
jgi:HSP20 family molecular chaperone IbpA